MTTNHEQIWEFVRQNGVRKIRSKGDDFEFLMIDGQVISPDSLFKILNTRINKKRPKKTIVGYGVQRRRNSSVRTWMINMSDSTSRYRMEPLKDFSNEEDKKRNEECNEEVKKLNQYWTDLKKLFNQIRFGVETIPSDLEILSSSLIDKSPARKKVALADAKEAVHKLIMKFHGKKQNIDICREYLSQNEILGKPRYTPEQLSNAVGKYASKLRNK